MSKYKAAKQKKRKQKQSMNSDSILDRDRGNSSADYDAVRGKFSSGQEVEAAAPRLQSDAMEVSLPESPRHHSKPQP